MDIPQKQFTEQIVFKNDIKYTKDGSEPYEDFLTRERNKQFQVWLDSLEVERLRQKAIYDARQAEQKRKIEAQLQKQRAKNEAWANRRKSCSTCDGSGFSWQTTTNYEYTITYDYSYSHGKHYKTYEHKEERKSGGYAVCPVCSGVGGIDKSW